VKKGFYLIIQQNSSRANLKHTQLKSGRLSPCFKGNTAIRFDWLLLKLLCYFILPLSLAACSSRNKPAPVINIYGSTTQNHPGKSNIYTPEYKVRAGETLYSIAWRANSDVRQLAALNNLSSPYRIYPGQKLFLNAKRKSSRKAKAAKATTRKHANKKEHKSAKLASTKVVKNTIASSQKQAYGKNVTGQKSSEKVFNSTHKFSQKIKLWQWPTNGKVIARFSTTTQGNKGLNIAGRRGSNIRAAASGKVVYVGSALRGYGKLIIIKHNDDYLSAYAHNDKILVKEQKQIKAGEVIAKMGDSAAQRVMLHFEVRFRGKPVNPLKYLPKK